MGNYLRRGKSELGLAQGLVALVPLLIAESTSDSGSKLEPVSLQDDNLLP